MREKALVITSLVILFLLIVGIPAFAQYRSPHTNPGPAVDKVTYKRVDLPLAVKALEAKEIDIYQFGLRGAQAKAVLGSKEISLYTAPSGLVDIVLNPAPPKEGELNPFTNQKIRFALNYILNRDFLVTDVFGGFAAPMVTFLTPFDPDFTVIFDIVAKYDFKYDPALAAQIIDEEMPKMGAVKVAGKWQYKGKPVTLNFIIRIEDERREVGDSFATELEKLGFTINRIYLPFGPAIDKIYGTDPRDFEWHLYTEGWGKTGVAKYDFADINNYIAPWYGYMPGWQESGFWQYENSKADEIGQKIYKGEFKDKEERDKLYRELTEIGILESIRIWGIARLDAYAARAEVTGLTNDVGAGLRAWHVVRNAYIPGKSELTVGHLWVWTERTTWNPIAGFQDVYSVDIARSTADPAIYVHPFNGLPIPIRASYDVKTAGPDGKLDVPSDAVVWDSKSKSWKNVGSGVKATSLVTFDYSKFFNSKWHHGIGISLADLLYLLASRWDIVQDEEKSKLEGFFASQNKPFFDTLKGIRILPDNRVEVYVDYWHFSPEYIAYYANIMPFEGAVPWELQAAMDKLVFDKKTYAYSQSASRARNVPWLNLVLSKHASDVASSLDELKRTNFFPESWFKIGDKVYESREVALRRYSASLDWYSKYGILWISDGPFMLTKFDSAAQFAELSAFRDPTYPFKPGDNFWGIPKPVEIVSVGKTTIVPGGEGMLLVDAEGPGSLSTIYLIKDPLTGEIIKTGTAEKLTPKRFSIKLDPSFTEKLRAGGLYEVLIATYSDEVAFVSSTKEFIDVLNLEPIKKSIEEVSSDVQKRIEVLSEDLKQRLDQRVQLVSSDVQKRLDAFSSDLAKAIGGVEGAINKLSSDLKEALQGVENGLNTVNNNVNKVSSDITNSLSTQLNKNSEDIRSEIKNSVNTVSQNINTVSQDMIDIKQATEGLLNVAYIILAISIIALAVSITTLVRRPK